MPEETVSSPAHQAWLAERKKQDPLNPMPIDLRSPTDAERGIIEVVYQCTGCDAINTERLFADKPTPVALCCVKCRSGFGMDLDAMVRRQVGMFPVSGLPLVGADLGLPHTIGRR